MPRPLEVGEELVPEADALARALDQPRARRRRRAGAPSGASTVPSTGCERRERIVRDLRPRVRDAREQRRLARVRQADERRVGEQLQVQLDVALLAGQPDLREARHLPRRRDEARVAAPAAAAAREHDARAADARGRRSDRRRRRTPACRPARAARRRRRRRRACGRRARCRRARPRSSRRRWSDERSRSVGSATSTTSPPSPPSPPSGPPFGTYFSRRNQRPPSPPRPAFTWICARSLNTAATCDRRRRPAGRAVRL